MRPAWKKEVKNGPLNSPLNTTFTISYTQRTYLQKLISVAAPPPHPGKEMYEHLCLACHQADGNGLLRHYPPLSAGSWVAGSVISLIRVITHGLTGPIIVDGKTYGVSNLLPMLPMGLTDTQAAEVLTYIRSNLKITRRQSALKPSSSNAQNSQAAVHRGQRRQHWLNDELLEFAHMRVLHFSREREMKESEMTLGGR